MSEIKSRKVFTQELDEQNKPEAEELTAGQQFQSKEKFVPEPVQEEAAETEAELETIIRPDKKKKWLAGGMVTAFTGLVGWQTVDTVMSAVQSGDWLTMGWSAFIASLAGLGIGAVGKELWKLRKLRHHFSVQEESESLLQSDSIGKGKDFCEQLAREGNILAENPGFDRWQNSINTSHSDSEILEMYDGMVLSQQDKLAKAMVARLATEAAVLVAVSPLAIADILLVAWRNFKLIDKLAEIYGVELGYWSRIRLFKLVLINMAAAGATEVAADASMDLLSMDLAGKVSTRVAQGFGVGILTARLGIKAMLLLRPIPWSKNNRVRLGEIRKELIVKLKDRI